MDISSVSSQGASSVAQSSTFEEFNKVARQRNRLEEESQETAEDPGVKPEGKVADNASRDVDDSLSPQESGVFSRADIRSQSSAEA